MWLIRASVLALAAVALWGCGDTTKISGPSDGATQNIALGGPAITAVKSDCAGNVNGTSARDADRDARTATTGTGSNTPNCSQVEIVAPPEGEEAAP